MASASHSITKRSGHSRRIGSRPENRFIGGMAEWKSNRLRPNKRWNWRKLSTPRKKRSELAATSLILWLNLLRIMIVDIQPGAENVAGANGLRWLSWIQK